jgi:hypothetical protein
VDIAVALRDLRVWKTAEYVSDCLNVCLSARNGSVPSERILVLLYFVRGNEKYLENVYV